MKETPKIKAQDYLATELSKAVYYVEDKMKATGEWQEMSEKERIQFKAQVQKITSRCIKPCGYDETWSC